MTGSDADADADAATVARVHRRSVGVLAAGQALGGIGYGATMSLGTLLAADVSGDDALAGWASAATTLGAALLAVPMARLARRRGRRVSLALGMAVALGGVGILLAAAAGRLFPLLLGGLLLIGAGQSANLQSRFAATDLATDATRGRDLALVVWATTIGSVAGPLLVGPGEALGGAVGLPPLTGPYLFTVAGQVAAIVLYLVGLRPDPLLLAQRIARGPAAPGAPAPRPDRPRAAAYAILAVAGSHGVMVAVMAMTPVHLGAHGAIGAVGVVIGLHILGMYGLSPVFGILSDRLGRVPTILLGQGLLLAALLVAAFGADSTVLVAVALLLIGLGWSAATVAGAALLTDASAPDRRTARQGRSDLVMNLVGAAGAVGAGVVLGQVGYGGLALACLVVVAITSVLAPLAVPVRGARAT